MAEEGTRLSRDEHRDLYRLVLLTRRLEERMGKLFRQNKIVGGLYRSTGQEAGAVGVAYATTPRDWVCPMIRDMGMSLARGWDPYAVLSQFMAKGDSPTRGRDGNLHFGSLSRRQPAPISHLGALLPVAAGLALSARMKGEDSVAVACTGDGGTSTGAFHEALNMIGAMDLPCVIVAQDNKWAYSTPIDKQMGCDSLADRAKAYGIPTMAADGNDIEDVVLTTRAALGHARRGDGPVYLVLDTFRICGHAEHDDARYVPRETMERWKALDPIDRHRGRMLDLGILDRAGIQEVEAEVDATLAACVERALAAPEADAAEVERWVYFDPTDPRDTGVLPTWPGREEVAG